MEKTVETKVSTEEESESEADSEEDSPKHISNRADRVGHPNIAKKTLFSVNSNLNTKLSNMPEEDQEEWGKGLFHAVEITVVHSKIWMMYYSMDEQSKN